MQWYTRTPAKNPAMKITTVVLAIAIPTLTLVVRGPTAPVKEKELYLIAFLVEKYNELHLKSPPNTSFPI